MSNCNKWRTACVLSLANIAIQGLKINQNSEVYDNGTWPINSVTPLEPLGYCKEEADVCPSIFLPLDRIWHELNKTVPEQMSSYVQNVGARDGKAGDPLYPVLAKYPHIAARMFEPGDTFQALQNNMKQFPNVELRKEPISPGNSMDKLSYRAAGGNSMDIFKLDIDGCECHILEKLLQGSTGSPISWGLPKIIQLELNHIIAPPISYKDMCKDDVHGRSGGSLDVWGCSMQAAYDLVAPHGYYLFQYDWPDGVFIHKQYADAFPCLPTGPAYYMRNYWIGLNWAREKYSRFKQHMSDRNWAERMPELAEASFLKPTETIQNVFDHYKSTFTKRPLWIEMAIAGTNVGATISADVGEGFPQIHWSSNRH